MSVYILGALADDGEWAEAASAAVAAAESSARLMLADLSSPPLADVIEHDTLIVLASSNVPFQLIEEAFATPVAQAARKIVDIVDGTAGAALFAIADMLIFTPEAIAETLALAKVPTEPDELLPVQARLLRHNQGAVVRLPGRGAVALWADRTMFVPADASTSSAEARAAFSGTIAGAVARKIGPELALQMALAATP